MDFAWLRLFFVLGIIGSAVSSPFYTIIAPKVVRPNSEYNIAITTAAISETATIYVELSANLDSGDVFNVSQIATVEPNTTGITKLQIGDVPFAKYKLVSRGLSGIEFHKTADIKYVRKRYFVLIQTDRAAYKQGSKLLFRVIVLDSQLRPAQKGTELDIHVTDGQRNRVKQWKQRMDGKGVFSGELQLSDEPVLGDWKIFVNVLGQTVEKVLGVAEVVRPDFEVFIDVPAYAMFRDSVIPATVRAKYAKGKPVKGEATITATTFFPRSAIPWNVVQRVVPIDENVTVDFDIFSDLGLIEEVKQPIQFEVTVEEALTGRKQNTSVQMTLHKLKYAMELIKTSEYYKPGFKYTTFIKIAYHDGSPVQDKTNPVIISSRFGHNFGPSYTKNVPWMLDEHGMIQLDFYPAPDSSPPLIIEARYLNLQEWFTVSNQALSPSKTYLKAVLKTENPTVNRDVEIEVSSTLPLKYFSYEVLGRGNVLNAAFVQVPGTKTTSFRFLATHEMAPTAHIIVHYMLDKGEIVADTLDVHLHVALQNFVNIATIPQEARPGGSVDLLVTSKPDSYVGLLGVDQNSILPKSYNDISHEQVLNELKSFDIDNEDSSDNFWPTPDWSATHELFGKSGAVMLTNGIGNKGVRQMFYGRGLAVPQSAPAPRAMLAHASIPGLTQVQPENVKAGKNLPETWLWQMLDIGPSGETVLQKSVPYAITSWVLTAFSVHPVHGFGLIEEPRKLKVFAPLFMSLDLPYSIIRGETVAISIVVFNYMDKNVTAEVTLENGGQFEFAETRNEVDDAQKLEVKRKVNVDVEARSSTSVSFYIVPKTLGYIDIKATATTALAGDSKEQKLLVKFEGEIQYRNKAVFVDLRNSTFLKTSFAVDIPKDAVKGSEHIEVSAVGDILGPSLANLANLINMPSGCGEQIMLTFVPNIVVLNYFKSTYQLTPAVEEKALKNIEIGYQRELNYRHTDGSFSAWGMSGGSGSTWLTAFVAKSFIQAAEHITIEDRIIKEALQWLASKQSPDGDFPEVGTVYHREMQGGAANGLALTAFTLITFLEDQNRASEYNNTINKGVDNIVRNLEGLDDVYSLCMCTYLLNLAKHPSEDVAFAMLESKATQNENYKWWSKSVPEDDKNPWNSLPSSYNVEMTSYAMLTYLRRNMVTESVPIMKWLVSQRNANGGFASTQDTVIGFHALSKLSEKVWSRNSDVAITFITDGWAQATININSENIMTLQKSALPGNTRTVNVRATGTGFGIIQVSYNYNSKENGAWPLFTLNPQMDNSSDSDHLQLTICSGFVPTKEANESNMAVMEVNLPSGFTVDAESIASLKTSQDIQRVETKNGDTVVALYFDKMVEEEYCPIVSAFRTYKVANLKPVPISIYDFYDPTRRAREFYEPRGTTLCDICESEDCEVCEMSTPEDETVECR